MTAKVPQSDTLLATCFEMANAIQSGVLFLNEEGHIVHINDFLIAELDYDKEKFSASTIFEINPSMSLLSWRKMWKKLIAENSFTQESEHITGSDSIYPVEMQGQLLKLGEIDYCFLVTKNKMNTERYKDMLQLTSQTAQIGWWEWDLINNQFTLSDEVYRHLEIPHTTRIDKESLIELLTSRTAEGQYTEIKNKLKIAFKNGTAFHQEFSYQQEQGFTSLNMNGQPVILEDRIIKIYGTLQNLNQIVKRTDDMYFTKYCMDYARDMIFWIDPDGSIRYVNQATCKNYGYTTEEFKSMNILDLSDDPTASAKTHWQELTEAGSMSFEAINKTKSGEDIHLSIVANLINYRGKKFNCAFARDLSGQKKRKQQLKMAKQSLDDALDMFIWLNRDGSFRYFNKAFQRKTGYSKKEIKEMTILDFFPGSTLEQFEAGWKKLEAGKPLIGMDRILNTKHGDIIPIDTNVRVAELQGRKVSITVMRDISEQKEKEKQIQQQMEEIKRLQEFTAAENVELREEINLKNDFNNIISRDKSYKKVLHQVEQVADTDATVLILGETGTGKELLARAIHQLSERSEAPMIKVNCGALPVNLIESELFGHERGSFTGAHQQKIGKFERAHHGTIFLDEIGELPLDLQTQLLRVLQEGEIERVGGTKTLNIDVRIIAATNRNLEKQVAKGKFREDLYYRLNVFPIYNLPLRERRDDIEPLLNHFVKKYSQKLNKEIKEISKSSLNKLMAYDFMGNVRELENMVERGIILAKNKILSFDVSLHDQKSENVHTRFQTLEKAQKEHIINALRRSKGKVSGDTGAAVLLGMNDKTLTSRMKKLGINKRLYQEN